jgi:predicted Rossmann fold nucleotide-binding protein DprA/Smf involved in DNA uptake
MAKAAVEIGRTDPRWPARLRDGGIQHGVASLWAIGELSLLDRPLLGLACSMRCPGPVILKTYDLARALRDAGVPVVGGFHSPMEKECLDLLLRGMQPIVVCPARGIDGMRLSPPLKAGVSAGRVLLVSPFAPQHRRTTADLAIQRNRFVADLADEVLVPHASPGGRIEQLCRALVAAGQSTLTLACAENETLVGLGVRAVTIDDLVRRWSGRESPA